MFDCFFTIYNPISFNKIDYFNIFKIIKSNILPCILRIIGIINKTTLVTIIFSITIETIITSTFSIKCFINTICIISTFFQNTRD